MNLIFEPSAEKDFAYFAERQPALARKILKLIEDIKAYPFAGIGKPEALKHQYSSYWSRRIDSEHRLIYRIEDDGRTLFILSCRYHY